MSVHRVWLVLWCLYISFLSSSASETAPSLADLELLTTSTTSCSAMNSSWQCRELEPSESETDEFGRSTLNCPTDTICILSCHENGDCAHLGVMAEPNSSLLIGCMETDSCRHLSVFAEHAHYVYVEGNTNHSVSFSSIQCPIENHLGGPNCIVQGSCLDFVERDHCSNGSLSSSSPSSLSMIKYLTIYSKNASRDVEISCPEESPQCIDTSSISCDSDQSWMPHLCHLWYDDCHYGCRGDNEYYDYIPECRPTVSNSTKCPTPSLESGVESEDIDFPDTTSPVLGSDDVHVLESKMSFFGFNVITLCIAIGSLFLLCLCFLVCCAVLRRRSHMKQHKKGQHLKEEEEQEMGNMVVIDDQGSHDEPDQLQIGKGINIKKRKRYWERADAVQTTSNGLVSIPWQPQPSQSPGPSGPSKQRYSDQSTTSGPRNSGTFERRELKRPSSSVRSRSHHDGLEDEAAQKLASSKLGDNTPFTPLTPLQPDSIAEMVKLAGVTVSISTEKDPDLQRSYQLALQIQQEQLLNANQHHRTVNLHRPTPLTNNGELPHVVSVTPVPADSGLTSEGHDIAEEKTPVFDLGGGFVFNVEPTSTHTSQTCLSISASTEVFDPEDYPGVHAEDEY